MLHMREEVVQLFNSAGIHPTELYEIGEPDSDGYTTWVVRYQDAHGLQEAGVDVRLGSEGVEFDVQDSPVTVSAWDLGAAGLAAKTIDDVGSIEGLTEEEALTQAVLLGVTAERYAWARAATSVPRGDLPLKMEQGFTMAEVAESLTVSERQIKRFVADKRMKSLKVGSRVVILNRHLEEFYENYSS